MFEMLDIILFILSFSIIYYLLIFLFKKKSNPISLNFGSGEMFDLICNKYDFINKVISLGFDQYWRNEMINLLNVDCNSCILDLATGTGDVAINFAKKIKKKFNYLNCSNHLLKNNQIVGIDTSEGMLNIGRNKIRNTNINGHYLTDNEVKLYLGDAKKIEFPSNHFDIVTIAFGIRNIPNRKAVFNEIHRVLLPDTGRAGILELNTPSFFLAKWFIYLIVPIIGFLLSGGYWKEYRYLERSIMKFPTKEQFKLELINNNLVPTKIVSFMFGAVTLYIVKPIIKKKNKKKY